MCVCVCVCVVCVCVCVCVCVECSLLFCTQTESVFSVGESILRVPPKWGRGKGRAVAHLPSPRLPFKVNLFRAEKTQRQPLPPSPPSVPPPFLHHHHTMAFFFVFLPRCEPALLPDRSPTCCHPSDLPLQQAPIGRSDGYLGGGVRVGGGGGALN